MALPAPLDQWGSVYCTPYGHVIAAHDGWIWSRPGAYDPVFIPAQMVERNPAELGHRAHFTRIAVTPLNAQETAPAVAALRSVFGGDEAPQQGYRLEVTSVSGTTLHFVFMDFGSGNRWGIHCRKTGCESQSLFMALDMKNKPGKSRSGQ